MARLLLIEERTPMYGEDNGVASYLSDGHKIASSVQDEEEEGMPEVKLPKKEMISQAWKGCYPVATSRRVGWVRVFSVERDALTNLEGVPLNRDFKTARSVGFKSGRIEERP